MSDIKLGCHVGMAGKDMFLASAREAASYGANVFMLYTGAPQNTRRKEIFELNIDAGWEYAHEHGINEIVVHAPYIINLANTVKPETYELAVEFLEKEIVRTAAMKSRILVLHPGSHVNAGEQAGIAQIAASESSVTVQWTPVIVNHYDDVFAEFDRVIGLEQIAVFHVNDSLNPLGAHKDRHANIGKGTIGYDTLHRLVHDESFANVPKILETPWLCEEGSAKKTIPPYKEEIEWLLK